MNKKEITITLINSIIFFSLMLFTIWFWFFSYIPIIKNGNAEDFYFYFSKIAFAFIQSITNLSIFCLIYIFIKKKISLRIFLIFFGLSTIITKFNLIREFHHFIRGNNLNINLFINNSIDRHAVSFQYTQMFLILIAIIFGIAAFLYLKRNIFQIFSIVFIMAFYLFFYVIHLYIVEDLYEQASKNYENQIESIIKNIDNYENLCKDLIYKCKKIELNEPYYKNEDNILNRVNLKTDVINESENIINEELENFKKTELDYKIIKSTSIQPNNLRAFSFAFYKKNSYILIIENDKHLSKLLDMHLFYFCFSTLFFLTIWGTGFYWLYKRHRKILDIDKMVNKNG